MIGIDDLLLFQPLNFAVLTVSDTRTVANDLSGDCLVERVKAAGHQIVERSIAKDDINAISTQATEWASRASVDVIITTGGTGLTGRDVTIEAILPLFEKKIDGFSVLFHHMSVGKIGLATLQSRACAGIVSGTFVFCLPGSTGAVGQAWDELIRDALDSRYRPSSLVDQIPRLNE